MKRAFVIGAGYFGQHLILALSDAGYAVDVLERGAIPQYRLQHANCHYLRGNAWNLSTMNDLAIGEYDCCFICLNDNLQTNLHVIENLRGAGAKQIIIRSSAEQHAQTYLDAGATRVVCPEEIASRVLVRELSTS